METKTENIELVYNSFVSPKPGEIKLKGWGGTIGGFGKAEVEETAGRLVQFFASGSGDWRRFRLSDLMDFYRSRGWDPDECLNGLVTWVDFGAPGICIYEHEPFLVSLLDGDYCITKAFIDRCFSYAKKEK